MVAALYAAIWIAFHFGAGYLAHRLSLRRLAALPLLSKSYGWEQEGRLYEPLGIRRWKDRLPEAGAFYRGGFSKRRLRGTAAGDLRRFALETTRAELSHWLTWGLSLTFFAWSPWQIGVIMVVYGALSNVPFIIAQRYNRARLHRAIRSLARRAHRDGAILPANAVPHQGQIERAQEDKDEEHQR